MTTSSTPEKPGKRRLGGASGSMGRALDASAASSRQAGGPPPASREPVQEPRAEMDAMPVYRFSMTMTEDLQDTADRLARKVRRLNGGSPVARSDLVRALLVIAADDQALTEQLAREIRAARTTK